MKLSPRQKKMLKILMRVKGVSLKFWRLAVKRRCVSLDTCRGLLAEEQLKYPHEWGTYVGSFALGETNQIFSKCQPTEQELKSLYRQWIMRKEALKLKGM